ncbi:MAG: DUF5989 family protein [Planctomycetaceae bacterium]
MSPQTTESDDGHVHPPDASSETGSSTASQPSWLGDFVCFLRDNKAWWLIPLGATLVLIIWLAWMTREPPRPPTYPHF